MTMPCSHDHGQQEERAHQRKACESRCGGRIPQADRMGDDVRPKTDRQADVAHRKERNRSKEGKKLVAPINQPAKPRAPARP